MQRTCFTNQTSRNHTEGLEDKMKKILFITRNYPPIKGGMEQYSYDLFHNLRKQAEANLIANKKGKKHLPQFFIKVFFYLLFNARKYDNIHFGDGVLSPLARFTKLISKAKVTITIHALDITYPNKLYQSIVPKSVNKLDRVVCMSNYTMGECVKRGVSRKKCIFITASIDLSKLKKSKLRIEDIEKKYNISLKNKKILFSIGRLIKRKGNEWFVRNVMPKLNDDYVYIIAGNGKEKDNIKSAINDKKLSKKVIMLGKIPNDEKFCLYENSDFFIMPNIKVKGDAEGFGITLIEAAAYGLPSLATGIEGITDAVINGKTGWLIKEKDTDGFINKIKKGFPKENIRKYAKRYSWEETIKKYCKEIFDC